MIPKWTFNFTLRVTFYFLLIFSCVTLLCPVIMCKIDFNIVVIKDFFSLLEWENYMSISSLFFTFVFIFKIDSGLNQVILCALFMWLIWCSSVRINQSNTWKQYFWVLLYNLVLITQALHQYFWVLLYNLVLITQTLHHLKIREMMRKFFKHCNV